MSYLEEEKKGIINISKEDIKSKKFRNLNKKAKKIKIINIIALLFIIIIIVSSIMIYLFFHFHLLDQEQPIAIRKTSTEIKSFKSNMAIKEEKSFALNINPEGNFSQNIYEGFETVIKKNITYLEDCSYTIFKHNESKSLIEFSKKAKLTIDTINFLNKNDNNMRYVLASFIVPKYQIRNLDDKPIKVKESYQNMLKEIDKSNNNDKKEKFSKIIEQIGCYVPNNIIYGGRIDLTFEIDKKYNIGNIEILKNEIFNSTYSSYSNSSNIIKSMEMFDNFACNVLGGGIKTFCEDKNLTKWYESLTIENSEIIFYDNLQPISDFLDEDLKNVFKIYFK